VAAQQRELIRRVQIDRPAYYLGLFGNETMDNFLSCTRRALTATTPKLWLGGGVPTKTKVEKVLDAVGSVLDEPSRRANSSTYFQPLCLVFLHPRIKPSSPLPLTSPAQAECMCFLEHEANNAEFMTVDRDGYLLLDLAYDKATIREGAHRFVLWSIFGPPPNDNWVVMHYCCNAACLNPLHLVWGTRGENLHDALSRRATADSAEKRIIERSFQPR